MKKLLILIFLIPAFCLGCNTTNDKQTIFVLTSVGHEYKADTLVPAYIRKKFTRAKVIHLNIDKKDFSKNNYSLLDSLKKADLFVVASHRCTVPEDKMKIIKAYVKSGKPVLGIRTASHGLSLRAKKKQKPVKGHGQWPAFDGEVFGGNYHGHIKGRKPTAVSVKAKHEILNGVKPFTSTSWLYNVKPIKKGATVLLQGKGGGSDEPVAWTFKTASGGKVFYTSLGHQDDFKEPSFIKLLDNACDWILKK